MLIQSCLKSDQILAILAKKYCRASYLIKFNLIFSILKLPIFIKFPTFLTSFSQISINLRLLKIQFQKTVLRFFRPWKGPKMSFFRSKKQLKNGLKSEISFPHTNFQVKKYYLIYRYTIEKMWIFFSAMYDFEKHVKNPKKQSD